MAARFPQYDELDLPRVADEVLKLWEAEDTFGKSLELRKNAPPFVFYEGPPSANGLPGIHHVMARAIKDIFCRYQTQKGHRVDRKAGWDTHGLPIELGVEKELGITKEDIGKKISIEEYNAACKKAVMRYTDVWNDMTRRIGFWLDLDHPYVTYKTKYIESVWWLLKKLYDDQLLYKGYTIQPYSPAAGTGLSSHELNQPGTYKPVKDTSVVAMFKVIRDAKSEWLFSPSPREKGPGDEGVFILAWTTTPWTLPSNCALTVGPKLEYVRVRTFNPYTHEPQTVVLAKARLSAYFKVLSGSPEGGESSDTDFAAYKKDGKNIPWKVDGEFFGHQLEGIRYEQLLPYAQPEGGDAFKVIGGDFVTTEDGTGVVHTAPSFGADDQRVARQHGIGTLTLVDLQGRFTKEMGEFAGKYVKNEYYPAGQAPEKNVDVELSIKLKTLGRAFKVEKYEHNYPHCWRTDKPILYYPLDSWFVRVTAKKDRLIALNKTINWKPESTGTGRFGNWLENLQDWNLSRSRYWGIPLPIWRTEDGDEELCIGSLKQLKEEVARAVKAGILPADPLAAFDPADMSDANYDTVDLHRPYVDNIVLVSPSGKPMKRETDLIDVWFDSGAMPYAQWHYPFSPYPAFPGGEGDASPSDTERPPTQAVHALRSADPMNYDLLKRHSIEMRKEPTPAEDALWRALRGKSLGEKFRRQHVLDNFILDFVCLDKRLVVEVDGGIHDHQVEYDEQRTARLNELGFDVIRFRNEEVLGGLDRVLSDIKSHLSARPSLASRNEITAKGSGPSPSGGGWVGAADFIAEGVDQTRGWFYTLHAISTLCFDQVAYKTVVSNGLVLDKLGQKMSKRLGNAVDPFKTLDQFGADAVRWYMISNASPWDNLKFDVEGITEVQRKFFRALFNTYNFFALYANIDGYDPEGRSSPLLGRGAGGEGALTESDRWILSRLNSVIKQCDSAYADYEPTIAARAIQDFVVEDLSNWYVRLNRRRFWKGEQGADKNAAFHTLYDCLRVVSLLSAPIAPFFSDRLYRDLTGKSVHLTDWPLFHAEQVDIELEQRTALAQKLTSLVLSIRKKEGHRVRQPLQKMMVPVTDVTMLSRLEAIRELVLGEVNVKELVILDASESKLTKKIKPIFPKLGARMGKLMKSVAAAVNAFTQQQIAELEANGSMKLTIEGQEVELLRDDVEITAENVPGLSVASDGALTVALDITLTEPLLQEGIARELVSRIQALRKESGFEVTDRIDLRIARNGDPAFEQAVLLHAPHIIAETLALTPEDQLLVGQLPDQMAPHHTVAIDERLTCVLALARRAN